MLPLIRNGLRIHLMQAIPKREFSLLIDPECLVELVSGSHNNVLQLVIDVGLLNPPIKIILLTRDKKELREPLFELITPSVTPVPFSPANLSKRDPRKRILDTDTSATHIRTLCALARHLNVDGVVTASSNLIEARDALYQHDLIKIVPLGQFADFVEICAHGHGVFWSASYNHALTHDVYYTMAHHKCQKLASWWSRIQSKITSRQVKEHLRSLVLNRYPFILYARDMVRFFQLQKDHFARLGKDRFGFPLSYHVNIFYLLVWGMLDHLCVVTNHVLALGLPQNKCGISSKDFLKALKRKKSGLRKFLHTHRVKDWIDCMSDFRHAVAHQVIPMPTRLLVETKESKKSREEILKIVETEDSDSSALLRLPMSPEVKTAIEDNIVFFWRMEKMKIVADHVVLLEGKRGAYWRSPVVSVDYDLAMLTAIMDAFLIGMFAKS
jgi:hypothetical protein